MSERFLLSSFITTVILLAFVRGYSHGAPDSACVDMIPQHYPYQAQSGSTPFTITMSSSSYTPGFPGTTLQVTLASTENANFKGFILQARGSSSPDKPVGYFTTVTDTFNFVCDGDTGNALTHTTPLQSTTSITVDWRAPSTAQGDIRFRATVVKHEDEFWTDVLSDVITEMKPTQSTTLAAPSTEMKPTQSTTLAAPSTDMKPTESATLAPPTSTKTPVQVQTGQSICRSDRGCFQNPNGCTTNCQVQLTWQKISDTHVRFELQGKTDGWVAFALSDDKNMHHGAVSECVRKSDDDSVRVGQSYNNHYMNEPMQSTLKLLTSSYKDGEISCSFEQEIKPVNSDNRYFNLNEIYIIQLGTGRAQSDGTKMMHSSNPIRSTEKFNTADSTYEKVTSDENDYNGMIKAHACLMITAWMMFVSTALILARYFKPGWPTRTLCGVKLWFSLHRACMVCALFLTTIGFIIVFVAVEGYSYRSSKPNFDKAHPPLGIIVTALIFINPIMSLCRCGPQSKHRPIFNWAHWAVGNIAFVLSVVVIFFGMFMKDRGVDPGFPVIWMMVAFVVLHVFTDIVLEISKCCKDSAQRRRNEEMEMQKAGMPAEPSTHVADSMRLEYVMLGFYLLGTIVLWLLMIIHIGAEIKY